MARQWTAQEKLDVTIATQCTSNNLNYVVPLSESWQGPLSVSVFTYDDDFLYTIRSILYYRLCFSSVNKYVTFHISFPKKHSPVDLSSLKSAAEENFTCSKPPEAGSNSSMRNYVIGKGIEYPINMLRTLAMKNVLTDYVLNLDIDLSPSANLRSSFVKYVSSKSSAFSNSKKVAYVVPTFEMRKGMSAPQNRLDLLKAWGRDEVRAFHVKTCIVCQKPTDYIRWVMLPLVDEVSVAYTVEFRHKYEPYFIARTDSLPRFDERFKQFAPDRLTQVN